MNSPKPLAGTIIAELRDGAYNYAMGRLDQAGVYNTAAVIIARDFAYFVLSRPVTSQIREDWQAFFDLLTGDLP